MLQKVLLSKYFNIKSTKQSDKINFTLSKKQNNSSTPFLGRSSTNNGIVDYVEQKDENLLNFGGKITIALDGSTGATFYQHHDFCSGQNIWILEQKHEFFKTFNPIVALYIVTTIRKAVSGYSYNLSLTKTRLLNVKIILPLLDNGNIDIDFIQKKMSELRNIQYVKEISGKRKY